MSKKDTSQLTDIWMTALCVYLYGTESLVGIDIETEGTRKNIMFTVLVPECDLQILQGQYHAKDENTGVIAKAFVDAYQFVLKIQKQVFREGYGTWRSAAWVTGKVA